MCRCANVRMCECANVKICKCANLRMFSGQSSQSNTYYSTIKIDEFLDENLSKDSHIRTSAHLHICTFAHLHICINLRYSTSFLQFAVWFPVRVLSFWAVL